MDDTVTDMFRITAAGEAGPGTIMEAASVDHGGNGQPVLPEATATVGHRGREAATLISLLLVLAAVWGATFFSMTRLWGEYRPATATLQEPPPPPTILVPSLTLDEAWDILGHVVGTGGDSHGGR